MGVGGVDGPDVAAVAAGGVLVIVIGVGGVAVLLGVVGDGTAGGGTRVPVVGAVGGPIPGPDVGVGGVEGPDVAAVAAGGVLVIVIGVGGLGVGGGTVFALVPVAVSVGEIVPGEVVAGQLAVGTAAGVTDSLVRAGGCAAGVGGVAVLAGIVGDGTAGGGTLMPVVGIVGGPIPVPGVVVGRDGGDDHRLGEFIADLEGEDVPVLLELLKLGVSQVGKVVCRSAALDGVPIRQNLDGIVPESCRCGCAADPHNAAVTDLKVSPHIYIKANTFRLVEGGGRRHRELRSAGHLNAADVTAETQHIRGGGGDRQRSRARNGHRRKIAHISGHDAHGIFTTNGDIVVASIGKHDGQLVAAKKPNRYYI